MKVHNTNSSSSGLKLPSLQISQFGKDRSCWMNIEQVANALNRNIDDLFRYFLSELGIEGTKGGENQANFKAKITQVALQKVLTKYINDYVRCPNCKSLKTIIRRVQSASFFYFNYFFEMMIFLNFSFLFKNFFSFNNY
jgi:translation initiation factor 2 subunit 2